MAAFAPEGFFEIWGILPGITSLQQVTASDWQDLAQGIINTQRFYRSICRNGYNLGLLLIEKPDKPFGTAHRHRGAFKLRPLDAK